MDRFHFSHPLRAALALAVALLPLVVAVPSAHAGTGVAVAPVFPPNVTVGQIGLPAAVQVGNASTAPGLDLITLSAVNLVPSCATTAATPAGDCPVASADPGVFQLSPTASGETGTGCEGRTFNVVVVNPVTGQVQFQPVGLPIVLNLPGNLSAICRIDFTINVLKAPAKSAQLSAPNTAATAQIGFVSGISLGSILGFAAGASVSTVAKVATATSVGSNASPSALGQSVVFTATVAGSEGGGTVGFFADGLPTALSGCDAVSLTAAGGSFQATCSTSSLTVGNHTVDASYSGDAISGASTGSLSGGQTVNPSPASITSAASATFTVGVAGSFAVTASGLPMILVTETGALPAGVTFNGASRTLSGSPAQGTSRSYPITFNAVVGLATVATQSFTLTVNQATMTYPTDGQSNVDTTVPFTWSTIPQAQAYYLVVGTTVFGTDLVSSGILPPTQSSFTVAALPAGPVLHATLLTLVAGAWTSYQAISFTGAAGQATFTSPVNGQLGIDGTRPFTWMTTPGAQGYILVVGTAQYGSNLFNSGVLPPAQSSIIPPALPLGPTLHATLLTKVNGAFTRFQAITFTAGPAMGSLNHPVHGQLNVVTPAPFTWTPTASAQNYYLVVGTTFYGTDLVNSGILPASQSSFTVPALPQGQLLYATLLTKINGNWVFQIIGFTAG